MPTTAATLTLNVPAITGLIANATINTIVSQISNLSVNYGSLALTSLTANSGNWQNTYTTVFNTSAYWTTGVASLSTLLQSNSANWENTYITVSGSGPNWDYAYNSVAPLCAVSMSVYTTVSGLSSTWNQSGNVNVIVGGASANWNANYSTVNSLSDGWGSYIGPGGQTVRGVYTTVNTFSVLPISGCHQYGGNWNVQSGGNSNTNSGCYNFIGGGLFNYISGGCYNSIDTGGLNHVNGTPAALITNTTFINNGAGGGGLRTRVLAGTQYDTIIYDLHGNNFINNFSIGDTVGIAYSTTTALTAASNITATGANSAVCLVGYTVTALGGAADGAPACMTISKGTLGTNLGTCTPTGLSACTLYIYNQTRNRTCIGNTIGGGLLNTSSGNYGTVAGGRCNYSGPGGAIGGGLYNFVADCSHIGGGYGNYVGTIGSIIGGGLANHTGGYPSTCASSISSNGTCSRVTFNTTVTGYFSQNNPISIWSPVFPNDQFRQSNIIATYPGSNGVGLSALLVYGDFNSSGAWVWDKCINNSGSYNTIGGGVLNQAGGNYSTVAGGIINTANNCSFVGGGVINTANNCSFVGGGCGNNALSGSTIGGGCCNNAFGCYSVVAGGQTNCATKPYTAVVGGNANCATADYATVVGGATNCASGTAAFIGTGNRNSADSGYGAVVNGNCNSASGGYSTIVGGFCNRASAGSFIGAGFNNTANTCSVVVGGSANNANGYSVIAGGYGNCVLGCCSIVVGGFCNCADSNASAVVGGQRNYAFNAYSFVGGGLTNAAAGYSFVGGGCFNRALQTQAVIGGGLGNYANGYASIIGGGWLNYTGGSYSTVAGGLSGCATGYAAFVGGGSCNTASGCYATIAGGFCNTVSSPRSFVAGGSANDTKGFADTFILGTGLSATAANYTYVNNLSTSGFVTAQLFGAIPGPTSGFLIYDRNGGPSGNASVWYKNNAVTSLYDNAAGAPNSGNLLSIVSSGNVGIGTLTPNARLTVTGSISATGTLSVNTLITQLTALSSIYIGTSPSQTLSGTDMSVFPVLNFDQRYSPLSGGYINKINLWGGTYGFGISPSELSYAGYNHAFYSGITIPSQVGTLTASMVISDNGNVGIGYGFGATHNKPNQTLTVRGSISASNVINAPGGFGTSGPVGAYTYFDRSNNGTSGAIYRQSGINYLWDNVIGTVISYTSGGTVGINTGTTFNTGATLTVNGTISAASGILTPAISSRFINLEHTAPNDGVNPVLFIGERGDGSSVNAPLNSLSGFNITYDEINNKLITTTQIGNLTPLTALAIDSLGRVGHGTLSPNQALTVVGNISATGDIVASGNIIGGTSITITNTTSYTFQLSDNGNMIGATTTTGITASPNTTITYPTGYQVGIMMLGTGNVTVSGQGLTVNQAYGYKRLTKQYSVATVLYTGAATGWVTYGDLTP
jgi:hypothetical protein